MSTFDVSDIDYPVTVTVRRSEGMFNDSGDYVETFLTVAENMAADIQLSLRVRALLAEDETGVDDDSAWTMFCKPEAELFAGDIIDDGSNIYTVDAVGDWGSHVECVLRRK